MVCVSKRSSWLQSQPLTAALPPLVSDPNSTLCRATEQSWSENSPSPERDTKHPHPKRTGYIGWVGFETTRKWNNKVGLAGAWGMPGQCRSTLRHTYSPQNTQGTTEELQTITSTILSLSLSLTSLSLIPPAAKGLILFSAAPGYSLLLHICTWRDTNVKGQKSNSQIPHQIWTQGLVMWDDAELHPL